MHITRDDSDRRGSAAASEFFAPVSPAESDLNLAGTFAAVFADTPTDRARIALAQRQPHSFQKRMLTRRADACRWHPVAQSRPSPAGRCTNHPRACQLQVQLEFPSL